MASVLSCFLVDIAQRRITIKIAIRMIFVHLQVILVVGASWSIDKLTQENQLIPLALGAAAFLNGESSIG
ncbi:hypothetical protein Tco_0442508 [Tanacetum coccineum]